MIIIGVTGPISHGKTSLCEAFGQAMPYATLYESSQIITDLAERWVQSSGALPEPNDIPAINEWLQVLLPIIKQEFGLDVSLSQVEITQADIEEHPEEYQKLFDFLDGKTAEFSSLRDYSKEEYRSLLQWMGGYFYHKISNDIWYNRIVELIQQDQANGITLAIVGGLRFPEDSEIIKEAGGVILGIQRPGLDESDLHDPTERQRQHIQLDSTVMNDGSLLDLQACAKRIYQDILADDLQPSYSATKFN